MRALSKIFAIAVFVTSTVACGGSSDSPPKPLSKRFDEIHVAKFTLEQKANIVKTRNDWEVSRMENAQAEAELLDVNNQFSIVRNDQKAAKLALENAIATKKSAEASSDTNRINQATKDLHTAELLGRAAEARVKYFDAYRAYVKTKARHTQENMYWREAQFEVAKSTLAQQNNIAPKGITYDWYPAQEKERAKREAKAREQKDSGKNRAQSARENWLKLQQSADQASGKPTALPDPMSPAVQSTTTGSTNATP